MIRCLGLLPHLCLHYSLSSDFLWTVDDRRFPASGFKHCPIESDSQLSCMRLTT
jgi:hypothetical protein